jgi:predicted DNA-binding transcriptional regulator YafY
MRYEPGMRLLRLATLLASSRVGLSLDEMSAELEVGRRTVERLRDQLADAFPALTHWDGDDRIRRWRLPKAELPAIPPSAGALATLEGLARDMAGTGDAARATDLREAAATLRALLPAARLRQSEPDIEALMQAEGSAASPGPKLKLNHALMTDIRNAILGFKKLDLTYRPAETNRAGKRILCPYGVLYGRRAYLIAHTEKGVEMRLWRIDRISNVTALDENFAAQEFNLAEYAARSFGVFQEPAQDVVLRFTPEAAEDAAEWVFHRTQTMQFDNDGSLTVRFCCGGFQELCWHLFTWGPSVNIMSPLKLKVAMRNMANSLVLLEAKVS